MYTTDSRFNNEVMTEYMISGKAIAPPDIMSLLDKPLYNDSLSALSLNPSNVSSENLTTPSLDLLS